MSEIVDSTGEIATGLACLNCLEALGANPDTAFVIVVTISTLLRFFADMVRFKIKQHKEKQEQTKKDK